MNKLSIPLMMSMVMFSATAMAEEYDGSWTNSYVWTVLSDQTVTSAPTVPTIYRGETSFQTAVGGTGNATVAIFSGGTVDMPSSEGLISDKGAFRLLVTDGAAVTLTVRKSWYSTDCHFELVDGTVSGEGGILFGGAYGKDSTIDIYGGIWTAPVKPNNWNSSDLGDRPAVRIYGGTFAPSSLLPVNTGYQYHRSNVLMAGGTFVCPSMKMSNGNQSRVTWFTAENGTDSILKLGDASVTWAGVFTLGEASLVRLQQNVAERDECLSIVTNMVGSGCVSIEGPSLDLCGANCSQYTGTITVKAGSLALGAAKGFGEGAKIMLDYPVGSGSKKIVTWSDGQPPENVTFDLSYALQTAGYTMEVLNDGLMLRSNRGTVVIIM